MQWRSEDSIGHPFYGYLNSLLVGAIVNLQKVPRFIVLTAGSFLVMNANSAKI